MLSRVWTPADSADIGRFNGGIMSVELLQLQESRRAFNEPLSINYNYPPKNDSHILVEGEVQRVQRNGLEAKPAAIGCPDWRAVKQPEVSQRPEVVHVRVGG